MKEKSIKYLIIIFYLGFLVTVISVYLVNKTSDSYQNIEIQNTQNVTEQNISNEPGRVMPEPIIIDTKSSQNLSTRPTNRYVGLMNLTYVRLSPPEIYKCNNAKTGYEVAGLDNVNNEIADLNNQVEIDGLLWCEEVRFEGATGAMYVTYYYYLQQNQMTPGYAIINYKLTNCGVYDSEISEACFSEINNFISQKIPLKNLAEFQISLINDGYIIME